MQSSPCHAPSPPIDARDLILRVLTIRKVARWCEVGEAAVYQWLHRGTPEAPIPAARIPSITTGAVQDGHDFDLGLLWPVMAGCPASKFAGLAAPSEATLRQ